MCLRGHRARTACGRRFHVATADCNRRSCHPTRRDRRRRSPVGEVGRGMALRAAGLRAVKDRFAAKGGLAELSGFAMRIRRRRERVDEGGQRRDVRVARVRGRASCRSSTCAAPLESRSPSRARTRGPCACRAAQAEHGLEVAEAAIVAVSIADGIRVAFVVAAMATVPLVERTRGVVEDRLAPPRQDGGSIGRPARSCARSLRPATSTTCTALSR